MRASWTERWAEYDAWNDAIEEVFFPRVDDPRPVYLSMENDDLVALAEVREMDAEGVLSSLVCAVRDILDLQSGPGSLMEPVANRTTRWRVHDLAGADMEGENTGEGPTAPPVLPFLALCTRAAEEMHRGDDMSSSNYYGRLCQLLELDDRQGQWLEQAYRKNIENFWSALNEWLERYEGDRGLRTARLAEGRSHHRFIRPAVHQALVRRADRDKLVGFFQAFDLAPGMTLDESDVEPMLDAWLSRAHTPSPGLRKLWNNATARPRVLEAVVAALENWDGSVPAVARSEGETEIAHARARLALEMSSRPPKRFLRFAMLINTPEADTEREAEVITGAGDVAATLFPIGRGEMSLGAEAAMDARLLLEGVFRMRDPKVEGEITRQPRAVVPFKQDVFSQRWVETHQVQLGDELRIAVRDKQAAALERILEEVARPGWSAVGEGFRLPEGWKVYRDIEVLRKPLSSPARSIDDFSFLAPSIERRIRVTNGLRVPTRFGNKWHVGVPPEIVAGSHPGAHLHLLVRDAGSGAPVAVEAGSDGAVVLNLAGCDLPEGEYRAELVENNEVASRVAFELVSSEVQDTISWSRLEGIDYPAHSPLGFLGVQDEGELDASRPMPQRPPARRAWENPAAMAAATKSSAPSIQFVTIDPDSCLHTGQHVTVIDQVERDSRNKPRRPFVRGECRKCGLARMFPTNYWRIARMVETAERAALSKNPAPSPRDDLPPIRKEDVEKWDVLVDALYVLGGGPWSVFERLALQVDQSGLFVDQALRSLEVLGHVNIRRDPITLTPVSWEVADTRVVPGSDGRGALAGYWAIPVRREMDELLDPGQTVQQVAQPDGPPILHLDGLDAGGTPVGGALDAVEFWLERLPRLSEVLEALPRRPFVASAEGAITRFNTHTARWVDADSCSRPGAYRLRRFGTQDVVRTGADLEQGVAATSTVQLSKHLAALMAGEPLMAYQGATLAVPLGADLPGMFGRVAVACSGRLPHRAGHSLVYDEVPEPVAARLFALMTN